MIGALFGLTCYVTLGPALRAGRGGRGACSSGSWASGSSACAIRPVIRHALSLSWVLSTVAVSIILKNAAVSLWGPEQIKFPSPFGDARRSDRPGRHLPAGALHHRRRASAPCSLVQVFLRASLLGKALMAVALQPERRGRDGHQRPADDRARLRALLRAGRPRRHPHRPDHLRLGLHGHGARHQGVRGGDLRRPREPHRHPDRRARHRPCSSSSSASSTRT